MVNPLEMAFPGLARGGYRITSPADPDYNCLAWAMADASKWWWPGPDIDTEYWPPGIPRETTLDAFRVVFVLLGYVECAEEEAEAGFEKVAVFTVGQSKPTHAARQLPTGRWTSKLGRMEDIEHSLRDLEGTIYGTVALILKRPIPEAG